METRNVAFLGLGVMGYPMAGHLARAGHRVTVYNRSADKLRAGSANIPERARPLPLRRPRMPISC
jgi:3-hydroxyisobutyrate dehydrogenase-like beta-hydroxyacid dehydrogenase